jgi:Superfamily II DNA/RNA helicases, SNF2 family
LATDPTLTVPERFRSAFRAATLTVIQRQSGKFQMRGALFFRGASTANVVESERRSFQPMLVVDPRRVVSARCACDPGMKTDDLCRHLGVLLARTADADGALPFERFETSVWRTIGFAASAEGRTIAFDAEDDPRELLLRKSVLTDQEQALLKRGSGTARLLWESSPWYRWAKAKFTDDPTGEKSALELRDGLLVLGDLVVPDAAVEQLVVNGVAARGGFEVAPLSITASVRIELTQSRALRFVPVLLRDYDEEDVGRTLQSDVTRKENVGRTLQSDATCEENVGRTLQSDGSLPATAKSRTGESDLRCSIHARAGLKQYGRFFFVDGAFASLRPTTPMFVERRSDTQASLFDERPASGIPFERETTIPESEVFAFLERHRDELAAMPVALAPDCVRNAQPVRLEGDVTFDFGETRGNTLDVEVTFETGVTAAEIAHARREGIRALNRGDVWIDVRDAQFDCFDSALMSDDGRLLVTPLDVLRIRGTLRGRAVFRGDEAGRDVFRMFDQIEISSAAPSPSALGFDLYAYQQTGYQWLWMLHRHGFGALLCDDMGLGKTHQAMALMRAVTVANPQASILVVCPTSVLDHWREKLARYLPGQEITLTSYGLVRSRLDQYRQERFDLVVLDEMQTIKNAGTATHQALSSLDKGVAIGLTGTPIENHEGELKTLLDFVVPGYLPGNVEDRATLRRLVRPFVLRRTKAQVLTELPPKIVDKRYCEMSDDQRSLYHAVIESRAKPLQAQLRAGASVSYVHVFAALNYLKQICNHPASAGGGFGGDAPSAKWDLFVELLEECMASGLKVVVFSQYLKMLELIEQHLQQQAVAFASIKGSTKDRGGEVARFRDDPDCRVFTASLRAGGLGIDLTSASVVIHYDRWWNQAREDQATDRVHRIGQNKGVQVIKLITRNSVEEKIDALIERKSRLASDIILDDDPALVKQFTPEELAELLGE